MMMTIIILAVVEGGEIAMAILRIPDENRSLQEHDEVRDFLTGIGIDYEYWDPMTGVPPDASAEQILNA